MSSMHVVSVAVSLVLNVPDPVLQAHAAASPRVVGEELAARIHAHVRREALGYYPPLDYFRGSGVVSEDLLDGARNLAWLVKELVREEVRRRLLGVFSKVRIDSVRSTAFTMPQVRPGQANALEILTQHYTPDSVRAGLVLTSVRPAPSSAAMEAYARQMLWHWLKGQFPAMRVTSSQLV